MGSLPARLCTGGKPLPRLPYLAVLSPEDGAQVASPQSPILRSRPEPNIQPKFFGKEIFKFDKPHTCHPWLIPFRRSGPIRLVARGRVKYVSEQQTPRCGVGEPLKKRSATRIPIHKRKTLPI